MLRFAVFSCVIYQGLCVSEVHVLVSRRGIRTIVHLLLYYYYTLPPFLFNAPFVSLSINCVLVFRDILEGVRLFPLATPTEPVRLSPPLVILDD